jgi:hypothetical protein
MSLFGSLFKPTDATSTQTIANALELATYAGGLASNPGDIDPILDRVRKITATNTNDQSLSPENEVELLDVYLDIEGYLTTRDPIRIFTKDELRSRLSNDLLARLTKQEMKGTIQ